MLVKNISNRIVSIVANNKLVTIDPNQTIEIADSSSIAPHLQKGTLVEITEVTQTETNVEGEATISTIENKRKK